MIMAELRSVDPRTLKLNPDNPRKTPVPKEMDRQLVASITAIGLLQPPIAREIDGVLVVRAGDRRTRAAIAAGKDVIDVYVLIGKEEIDAMATMSENLVRCSMGAVDTWRGIEKLEQQGWNEEAIANALALPPRTVRKLKLLGSLHPPMLDVMAKGSMPNEDQLRTIANAPLIDQLEVWKKLKPKKGHDVGWWEVARALSKPRIPFAAAKFDATMAEEYGVIWLEDLFAPAGEESRYTTNAEGFYGAQQAWMAANLPENGTILTQDEHGRAVLPKGAERIFGKPTKSDKIGHYIDSRSGEVETLTYRMPEPKKPAKAAKSRPGTGAVDEGGADAAEVETEASVKSRPDVTQKGLSIIGDYRTDALHQALDDASIPAETLVGLLTLALAADNVSVQSDRPSVSGALQVVRDRISEGGVLTTDPAALHVAAREMLKIVLSCRRNMTDSGISSRVAGETLGASRLLPTMATDEFLSCLSRQALERSAAGNVRVEPRVKDTRAAMIAHFRNTIWHFPGALFAITTEERATVLGSTNWRTAGQAADEDGADDQAGDALRPDETESLPYPVAAE
jgi:ParB family chromosome partitioning protein